MGTKSAIRTREEWLERAVEEVRPRFVAAGYPLPSNAPIRVSVGFPSRNAVSRKRRTIGQCWSPTTSADGSIHLFVSPVLETPLEMIDVLMHELVHAAVGCECGHRGAFVKACNMLGMAKGKPKNAGASDELLIELQQIVDKIGNFPHAALKPTCKDKVQTTRLLKAECGDCGYVIRVTRKWVDESGLPICPCGEMFQLADV